MASGGLGRGASGGHEVHEVRIEMCAVMLRGQNDGLLDARALHTHASTSSHPGAEKDSRAKRLAVSLARQAAAGLLPSSPSSTAWPCQAVLVVVVAAAGQAGAAPAQPRA